MSEAETELQPASWQMTATTVSCGFVDELVTIIVKKDWSTNCVWFNRYKQKALDDKKYRLDKNMKLKIEKCQGPACAYVTDYRSKLAKEEFEEK